MVITPLGLSAFKIQTAQATVLIDPFDGKQGLKPARVQADLVVLTQSEGRDASAGGTKAFVVEQPGEFEVQGVAVTGVPSADGKRTLALFTIEDVTIGHLGDLDRTLQQSELEQLDGVDVLFIPVGGHGVLDARKAAEVIGEVEPRLVIPMNFKTPGLKVTRDPVAMFLKEFGARAAEPQEKFRLSKKDLPQDDTHVVILEP